MQKLQLKDLFSVLQKPQQQGEEKQHVSGTNATQEFLAGRSHKIEELPLKKQLELKRESTYRTTQQEMDKWIGIVKLNREKDSLNFAKTERDNAATINFFPSAPMNQFHSKLEGQLKQMELQSQQTVMKTEENALEKLTKEEAQQRLKEARKQRTLVFNEEIKRRRIAKIKSKLYHKIKKRQKLREESKRIDGMDAEEKNQYVQKLAKQRIHERITLRHKSKNKHIQSLLRFSKSNKNAIQDSINEVNLIRKQQLEKVNEINLQQMSEEYDDQKYREQALDELQKEIDEMEQEKEEPKKGLEGMKFMKLGREKEMNDDKREAQKLLNMLEKPDGQFDHEIDEQEEEVEEKQVTRRKFGEANAKDNVVTVKQDFTQKNLKKVLVSTATPSDLTSGIDINRLKEKYQPNRVNLDLREAIDKNKQIFSVQNDAILQNYRDFQANKHQEYEANLPTEQKKVKGWGNWAGPGISEPKIDHALEVKKKLAKIQQIKRKRRDGEMAGVIVREAYNKNLKDYFVNKVPHNFKSPEQFDYLQDEKLGPEWNTMNQFKSNIKPKVITKAGQVIEPIKLPKKLDKTAK